MGNFTLLTTLTLNAAGFDKGIDKAKKSAKALGDGIKTAGQTMANAFTPLTSAIGGFGGQFTSLAVGGISAFKKMIPAINGVRTAFIATGIGAIIIGITTAIAALVGWMKRTDEGSDAMRKAFDIIKAVINTTLEKVTLLGSALMKLLKGDFKGAAEDAKQAFTGWGDAMKENIATANKLNQAQDKLEAFNVDYLLKREQIVANISEMEYKIKDAAYRETLSAKQKIDLLNQYKSAQAALYSLDKQKFNLEMSVAQETYNMGAKNEDTLQVVNDKKAEGLRIEAQHNDELRASLRLTKEIKNEIAEQADITKETLVDVESINDAYTNLATTVTTQVETMKGNLATVKPMEILNADQLAKNINTLSYLQLKFKETMESMKKDAVTTGQILYESIGAGLNMLGNTLIQGASDFKTYAKNVKSAIKSVIGAFIAEGVAAMVGNALKSAAKTPYGFLFAPALAALAGGIAKTAFNSLLPKFHTGGIVGGVGEVQALLKPREMILTQNQQSSLFNMINRGTGGGEVVFRIQDNELVGILSRYNRKSNGYV